MLLAVLIAAGLIGLDIAYGRAGLAQWPFHFNIVAYVVVGALIIIRRPQNRIGRLCLAIGWLSIAAQGVPALERYFSANPAPPPGLLPLIARLSLSLAQGMAMLMFIYLPLLFPDGRFLTGRWRRFGQWYAMLVALPICLALIKPGPMLDWANSGAFTYENPLGVRWTWLENVSAETLFFAWSVPTLLATFAAIGSLVLRWRRSGGDTRQQIKWVVYFLSSVVALYMLYELLGQLVVRALFETPLSDMFAAVAFLGFPLVIGLAVFKYRLYDIDVIINRTLVYGGLTALITAVYVLVVVGMGALFQSRDDLLLALLATGLIAVLFQPLRDRLQRAANRLMFGERDDPYAVLSQLSQQLQGTAVPAETLQTVVETIAKTLKLSYVAIELLEQGEEIGRASVGEAVGGPVELPLRYQNEAVGRLLVSPRSPGERFTAKERQLLADIAGQAGAVASATRLMLALQRSREGLVLAREEERRRIRRDLHDELGPTLAGQTLKLDTLLELLADDPQAATEQVRALKTQNQHIVADIRRLVYELRPPTLDELGLLGALQVHVAQLDENGVLDISIKAVPEPLPALPAAIEVAAYRIALEAVTNVIRHAAASQCRVELATNRTHLALLICDDGVGLSPDFQAGVGLASMRQRAEELGGRCNVSGAPSGGTVLQVHLPLPEE
jgi:signal transduction histidine kinase